MSMVKGQPEASSSDLPRRDPAIEYSKYVVARASHVPEGERLLVEIHGRPIGIFHFDGEFHALLNRCPHQGGPLCRGEILGLVESDRPGAYRFSEANKMLACPWHGWEFDIRDGQSYFDPVRTRARPYQVSVEHGDLVIKELDEGRAHAAGQLVKGPYTAEVLEIAVEDDFLVVSMRSR